ncbi:hypothetical protein WN55_09958 [Dufourea novaeangliae]|uniref:Uncharacterized protein n=1 Tax=Dufourea novaeangliae TaxID=178035 RepID=A0A154P7K1_DUFNO|nr:hypothetical protein WN55_09958 [Dufourea novaeangliae]
MERKHFAVRNRGVKSTIWNLHFRADIENIICHREMRLFLEERFVNRKRTTNSQYFKDFCGKHV